MVYQIAVYIMYNTYEIFIHTLDLDIGIDTDI